jgi:hypothetical protein
MADRSNHYERAFEGYLRVLRVASIGVDESRRAFGDNQTIKNLDFIVTHRSGQVLLVDVKGRRLSCRRRTRQNWATKDDVQSLRFWERRLGPQAQALLVFVYQLEVESMAELFEDQFTFEDRHYGCLAIAASGYEERMRVRSPRWGTVSLRKADFDSLARPISSWLR